MKTASKPARMRINQKIPARPKLPFAQEIELVDRSGNVIAMARWHAPAGDDGIVQLVDLHVEPDHQRQGHGSDLLRAVYAEAAKLFNQLDIRPRRIFANVEQKGQIRARAFFSRHGFHHVSTIKNLFRRQDALIYLRAFD